MDLGSVSTGYSDKPVARAIKIKHAGFNLTGHKKGIMKRIKHNDLLPWFIRDHDTLPAAYLASCEKFFRELQASSTKRQASSLTDPESGTIKDLESRKL